MRDNLNEIKGIRVEQQMKYGGVTITDKKRLLQTV